MSSYALLQLELIVLVILVVFFSCAQPPISLPFMSLSVMSLFKGCTSYKVVYQWHYRGKGHCLIFSLPHFFSYCSIENQGNDPFWKLFQKTVTFN